MTRINIGEWILTTRSRIKGNSGFPNIEINVIAAHVLKQPKEWIVSHPETELSDSQLQDLEQSVIRLLEGEPLAYITGKRSFYGLDFKVNKNVLIPRPETELMVEESIRWLGAHPQRRMVADIGTGSGVIAITIAKNIPDVRVMAIDVSPASLELAKGNAKEFRVDDSVQFKQNDLLSNIVNKFDLILANLPYIPSLVLDGLEVNRYEPRLALDGGENGLDYITKLLEQSQNNVLPGACIFLEIQYNQSIQVSNLARGQFPGAEVTIFKDLASLPRLIRIQL